MVKIITPYKEIDSRWPFAPCTLRCNISDESWVELRFDPNNKKVNFSIMKIYRTYNRGESWIEISTRLKSCWQQLAYGEYWPPDPMDLCEFLVEGDYMEAKISEVAWSYVTGGVREWKAVYNHKKGTWSIVKLPDNPDFSELRRISQV